MKEHRVDLGTRPKARPSFVASVLLNVPSNYSEALEKMSKIGARYLAPVWPGASNSCLVGDGGLIF